MLVPLATSPVMASFTQDDKTQKTSGYDAWHL